MFLKFSASVAPMPLDFICSALVRPRANYVSLLELWIQVHVD